MANALCLATKLMRGVGTMRKAFILALVGLFLCFTANAMVINEIMYNPNGSDTGREWVEVYNSYDESIDITGWKFREADTDHQIVVAQGNPVIPPESYFVIADKPESFLIDYPGYSGTVADSTFSLSNTGEYLGLKDSSLNLVDELTYSSEWGGDDGYSLELIDPSYDNSLGSSWATSEDFMGTPGEENSVSEGQAPEFSFVAGIAALGICITCFLVMRKN